MEMGRPRQQCSGDQERTKVVKKDPGRGGLPVERGEAHVQEWTQQGC